MKILLSFIISFTFLTASAQGLPADFCQPNIKTIKFFRQDNQASLPVMRLNSGDQLELDFDDMDAYAKSYYYTFQLYNADWTPADINPFDYIRGFTQMRLSEYRQSYSTQSKYVHYQAILPDRNSVPSKSGNYLLKVYLDGDTSKLAFTKKFFVADNKAAVSVQIMQPFNSELFRTTQKIQISVNDGQLNPFNPADQIKLVILQNYRLDNAITNIRPSFIRSNILEYNGEEDCLFPAGREYRWADLRSFRLLGDRVERIDKNSQPNEVYMRPDLSRTQQSYIYLKNLVGWYNITATESINPWWESDYSNVHFTYVPANHQPYAGKDVFLMGEITGNTTGADAKMQYNAEKGVYEKTMLMKQGYYSYCYVTKDRDLASKADASITDGNYWETENEYTVLVYFRGMTDRYDQLVSLTITNSRNGRGGF